MEWWCIGVCVQLLLGAVVIALCLWFRDIPRRNWAMIALGPPSLAVLGFAFAVFWPTARRALVAWLWGE